MKHFNVGSRGKKATWFENDIANSEVPVAIILYVLKFLNCRVGYGSMLPQFNVQMDKVMCTERAVLHSIPLHYSISAIAARPTLNSIKYMQINGRLFVDSKQIGFESSKSSRYRIVNCLNVS
ncbi:hypothetical protein V6N13_090172 [Hibiscus sabdariffa]